MKNKYTTNQALSTVFAYHSNPNYGNIPDEEIDQATLFLANYIKGLEKMIPFVLMGCPFDKIERGNKRIYETWCIRILETIDMKCEDIANEKGDKI